MLRNTHPLVLSHPVPTTLLFSPGCPYWNPSSSSGWFLFPFTHLSRYEHLLHACLLAYLIEPFFWCFSCAAFPCRDCTPGIWKGICHAVFPVPRFKLTLIYGHISCFYIHSHSVNKFPEHSLFPWWTDILAVSIKIHFQHTLGIIACSSLKTWFSFFKAKLFDVNVVCKTVNHSCYAVPFHYGIEGALVTWSLLIGFTMYDMEIPLIKYLRYFHYVRFYWKSSISCDWF